MTACPHADRRNCLHSKWPNCVTISQVRLLIDIVANARMWVEWRSAFLIASQGSTQSGA